MSVQRWPVVHFGYVWPQRNRRAYGHHQFKVGTRPGAHRCGICGRWVIRGMGRWWL